MKIVIVTGSHYGLGVSTAIERAKPDMGVMVSDGSDAAKACAVVAAIMSNGKKGVAPNATSSSVAGAPQIPSPGPQLHGNRCYHGAEVRDPDGRSRKCVCKEWQH